MYFPNSRAENMNSRRSLQDIVVFRQLLPRLSGLCQNEAFFYCWILFSYFYWLLSRKKSVNCFENVYGKENWASVCQWASLSVLTSDKTKRNIKNASFHISCHCQWHHLIENSWQSALPVLNMSRTDSCLYVCLFLNSRTSELGSVLSFYTC